jgi:hypothetical protein
MWNGTAGYILNTNEAILAMWSKLQNAEPNANVVFLPLNPIELYEARLRGFS